MRVLVTTNKGDFDRLPEAVRAVEGRFQGDEVVVVDGGSVPWQDILVANGSWDALYDWTLSAYEGLVLLESEAGYLGRGTFEMAYRFLAAEKPVGVVRDGKVVKVTSVNVFDKNDWKGNYGAVTTEEKST